MGCCGSTQAGDSDQPTSSAAPAPQPSTSQTLPITPITSAASHTSATRPLQVPSISQSQSQSQSPSRSSTPLPRPSSSNHTPRLNLPSERYNSPLTRPSPWTSPTETWTPTRLHRERHEFFDTRVTGRPEIWGALQNMCELVRSGDVATAQGILDAAGITLPTGNLVDGCYDEVGNLYRLPEVVVSDPVNTVREGGDGEIGVRMDVGRLRNSSNIDGETMIGVPEAKIAATAEDKVLDGGEGGDVMTESREMSEERRREEKGKGSERDAVKVRCRLSDRGGPDVVIALGKTQHVATLVRRVQTEGNVSPALTIRLAYLGKILNENDTLEAQGWKEGHVINAMVVGDIVVVPGPCTLQS